MNEQTNNQTLDVVAVRDIETPVIDAAMFDQLNDMPEGFSLQSAYLKFESVGHVERAFFVGFTDMMSRNKANGMTQAAVFMWKDPQDGAIKRVINAGDNLVKQLQNLPFSGQPIPVKITFLGKKRANSGNDFNAFDVVVLGGVGNGSKSHSNTAGSEAGKPQWTPAQKWHKWASETRATADNADDVRGNLKAAWAELGLSKPADVTTLQGAIDWLKSQTQPEPAQ